MKVAVIGSRGLKVNDLGKYLPKETTEIISGGAVGIDYEKKNVMRSKSSDKRRIHTEYRKHFA